MPNAAAFFTLELITDVVYWLVFFSGTTIWFMLCAGAAVRSRHNPLASRWEYCQKNWDIFAARQLPDLCIFWVWRHVSLSDVLGAVHLPWGLQISGSGGFIGAILAGFFADVLIAAILKSRYVPEWARKVVQERIPELPQELVATVETTTTVKPVDESQQETTTKTITGVTGPSEK